jgi:hypothetical protein
MDTSKTKTDVRPSPVTRREEHYFNLIATGVNTATRLFSFPVPQASVYRRPLRTDRGSILAHGRASLPYKWCSMQGNSYVYNMAIFHKENFARQGIRQCVLGIETGLRPLPSPSCMRVCGFRGASTFKVSRAIMYDTIPFNAR